MEGSVVHSSSVSMLNRYTIFFFLSYSVALSFSHEFTFVCQPPFLADFDFCVVLFVLFQWSISLSFTTPKAPLPSHNTADLASIAALCFLVLITILPHLFCILSSLQAVNRLYLISVLFVRQYLLLRSPVTSQDHTPEESQGNSLRNSSLLETLSTNLRRAPPGTASFSGLSPTPLPRRLQWAPETTSQCQRQPDG